MMKGSSFSVKMAQDAGSFYTLLLGAVAIAHVHATGVQRPVSVHVANPAAAAVPILFDAKDYKGPYDPLDPKGVVAAGRRAALVGWKSAADVAASYVVPGAFEMLAKDLLNVFLRESKRFAVNHPVESAELNEIWARVAALVTTAVLKDKGRGIKKKLVFPGLPGEI